MPEKNNPVENTEFKAESIKNVEAHSSHEVVDDTTDSTSEKDRHSVEDITKKIEAHAVSGKEMSSRNTETEQTHHPVMVNKQLKDMSYSRAMTRVRKHLPAPSRALSKIVHSPLLDKPSELASKTVARPSSMLGGGLFAMIGTALLLWTVNKHGYEYNYLAVAVLFLGGAIAGLAAEGTIRLLKRRTK